MMLELILERPQATIAAPTPVLEPRMPTLQDVLDDWSAPIQILPLLRNLPHQSEEVITLIRYLFSDRGVALQNDEVLPHIEKLFREITTNPEEFDQTKLDQDSRDMRGALRKKFADPILGLMMNNQTPVVAAILLNYLSQIDRAKCLAIYKNPILKQILVEGDYRSFPLLNRNGENAAAILDRMIREFPLSDEAVDVIFEAFHRRYLSIDDVQRLGDTLRDQIKTVQGTTSRCICLKQNEPLLRKSIQTFHAIRDLCAGSDAMQEKMDQELEAFRSIFVLDLDHLTRPQYRKGEISGLHDLPENDYGNYGLEDEGNIEVRLLYPRLLMRNIICAPFSTRVSSIDGMVFRKKMSSFPLLPQNELQQIQMIESVLLGHVNDPSRDGNFLMRRYFGIDANGDPRVVWTHENVAGTKMVDPDGISRIGTSFLTPFFESRDTDPRREIRSLAQLRVQHEQILPPTPIPPVDPQEQLFSFLQSVVQIPAKESYNSRISLLEAEIIEKLSLKDSPFKIVPTHPGGPILVQATLNGCGLGSLPNILHSNYTPSNTGASHTKRLPDEDIDEVFNDKANGISVLLQYPSMKVFLRMFLKNMEERETR